MVADCLREFPHDVPPRPDVHRVPGVGVLGRPHGVALVVLGGEHGVLGTGPLEKLHPFGRIEKFKPACKDFTQKSVTKVESVKYILKLLEVSCEILVCEVGRIIILDEFRRFLLQCPRTLPVAPEPLGDVRRDREDAKVDEDADAGLVEPLQWRKNRTNTVLVFKQSRLDLLSAVVASPSSSSWASTSS